METTTQAQETTHAAHADLDRAEREFFTGLATNIVENLSPQTVLDAGSPAGVLVADLRELGVDAHALNWSGLPAAYYTDDVQDAVLTETSHTFDLVVFVTLPGLAYDLDLVDTLAPLGDTILFAADPKFHTPGDWADAFAAHGFFVDVGHNAGYVTPWAMLLRQERYTDSDIAHTLADRIYDQQKTIHYLHEYYLRTHNVEEQLQAITNTRAWQAIQGYWRARDWLLGRVPAEPVTFEESAPPLWWADLSAKLFPAGTRRERGYLLARTSWRVLRVHGPVALIRQMYRYVVKGERGFHKELAAIPPPERKVTGVPGSKVAFRARTRRELHQFLKSDETLTFPPVEQPTISIILVLYNQADLTYACLLALQEHLDIGLEIIIVDNNSTDETRDLLDKLDGVKIAKNDENLHFLRGVNFGAGEATGEYLLLLNNDALVQPGALDAAIESLQSANDIGAVGARLILPDGTLQEAGSIIWNDGSLLGYGRGDNPMAGAYMFRRDVDYCSGAFLLIKRHLFEQLGRFDEVYAPAYYEETDFCVRLHEAGYRIVYDPRVEVHHYEFASSSSDSAIELMQRNHRRFIERQQAYIAHKQPHGNELLARDTGNYALRVLYIDQLFPLQTRGSGYPRARELIHTFHDLNCFVTMVFVEEIFEDWEKIWETVPVDVEVLPRINLKNLTDFMTERAGFYDVVFVSRPHIYRQVFEQWQNAPEAINNIRIVYDAEAIFAQRVAAQRQLMGVDVAPSAVDFMLRGEIGVARSADTVLSVSEYEKSLLERHGCPDVRVVSHLADPAPTPKAFDQRRDLFFVGRLKEQNTPNTDSMQWFIEEILPLVLKELGGDVRLKIAGITSMETARFLRHPNVDLLGVVDDLTPLYNDSRIFIAPTRFSAGIPLKITEAAAKGIPVVATALLGRQLAWEHERELLLAGDAKGFAAQIIRLYRDESLWNTLRENALTTVQHDYSRQAFKRSVADTLFTTPP